MGRNRGGLFQSVVVQGEQQTAAQMDQVALTLAHEVGTQPCACGLTEGEVTHEALLGSPATGAKSSRLTSLAHWRGRRPRYLPQH